MAFPFHDRHWVDAAEFVRAHASPGDRILAPDIFGQIFDRVFRYRNTSLRPDARYDWAILHKGELDRLTPAFLRSVPAELRPVWANAVFVIWTASRQLRAIDKQADHLRAYFAAAAAVSQTVIPDDPVLPDPGMLEKLESLSPEAFRASMNAFWKNGGYRYETARDRVYFDELERLITELLGPCPGEKVLDLCCGIGRPGLPADAQCIVGVDISAVAIDQARERLAARSEYTFRVMDAHALDFPDASFDTVLFLDAIEHVKDARQVVSECARLTRPGGRLIVTGANRDSLHLRLTRSLGYPAFKTNNHHIAELSYAEMVSMLSRCGYRVTRAEGVLLYPYWGIPGLDEKVRRVTDDDPEIVETLRVLGRRAGPEHAYAYVIAARRAESDSALGHERPTSS